MKFKNTYFAAWRGLATASICILCSSATVYAGILETSGNYGVIAGSTITNTGTTVVTGDIGLYPGTSITGFSTIDGGPGSYTGTANVNNSAAIQAATDLQNAYTSLHELSVDPSTIALTGSDLGTMILTSGVYYFATSAQLTGTLTLNAEYNPNARFVFIIGSTLTTAASSNVVINNISTSTEGADCGVYWIVGTSATIGTDTGFAGNILADASITLNAGSSIDYGRALAINGAVTLSGNTIDASDISGGFGVAVPEPATYALFGSSVALGFAMLARRRRK